MAKRKARSRINLPETGHREMLAVRPPAIPSKAEHGINLTMLRVRVEFVAEWLKVDTGEVICGDCAAVRVAVAHYLDHQNSVSYRRL